VARQDAEITLRAGKLDLVGLSLEDAPLGRDEQDLERHS